MQVEERPSIPHQNIYGALNQRSIGNVRQRDRLVTKTSLGFLHSVYPNQSFVARLKKQRELKKHRGCVNTVNWSSCGNWLVSGSDDTYCCVWDMHSDGKLSLAFPTGHTANIFCTKFMPESDNKRIITCAGDSEIRAFQLQEAAPQTTHVFTCHNGRVKKLVHLDPNTFLSCSEDGTVRLFDLREPASKGGSILVNLGTTDINCIAMADATFCIGCGDPFVRVYDVRKYGPSKLLLEPDSSFAPDHFRETPMRYSMHGHVTGVDISKDGREVLGSYSGDSVFLFNINENLHAKPLSNLNVTRTGRSHFADASRIGDVEDSDDDNDSSDESSGDNDVAFSYEQIQGYDSSREIMEEGSSSSSEDKRSSSSNESSDDGSRSIQHENNDAPNEMGKEKEAEEPKTEPVDSSGRKGYFKHSYSGHCNIRTIKGVSFFGPHDEYVCSGSDDGRIFIWEKKSSKIINILKGDSSVVNVISGHPFDPILATSGIDNEIRVWMPTRTEPRTLHKLEDITRENQEMMRSMSNHRMISLAFLRRLIRQREVAGGDEEEAENIECGLQ